MKRPDPNDRADSGQAAIDIVACPFADECRRAWQTLPKRDCKESPWDDDVAVCAHCYQWLPRSVLAEMLAGKP